MPKKLTQEEFLERALKIRPTWDFSKAKYMGSQIKVEVTCNKGHKHFPTPGAIFIGQGCKKCKYERQVKKQTLTQKQFLTRMKKDWPNYDCTKAKYINALTKVIITCDNGHCFNIRPNDLFNKHGCKICSNQKNGERNRLTQNQFDIKAKNKFPAYDFSKSKYVNKYTKIEVTCDKKHTYMANPGDILGGHGCPVCCQSKGEKIIRDFLINKNINFSQEFKFNTCKNKRELPFDFYIPHKNLLIEYQGEQHFDTFRSLRYYGGKKAFLKRQQNDCIKSTWAKEHGYKLLTPNYTMTEAQIRRMLEKALFNKWTGRKNKI